MRRRMVDLVTGLALVLAGCGSPPEPKQKTPEELAKEREEFNRKMQENIDAIATARRATGVLTTQGQSGLGFAALRMDLT